MCVLLCVHFTYTCKLSQFRIIFFYIVDILQRISEMEGRLISEIKCNQPVIHPQEKFVYDPDMEECLSLLSSNMHPSGSSVVKICNQVITTWKYLALQKCHFSKYWILYKIVSHNYQSFNSRFKCATCHNYLQPGR